ncbi:TetR/AcrR family transcriptional regulator [Granulicoccus phenolivorans]|uniref:TetR/AcrR family transcriptional regulator n=1 Tax=Granulicoccus phenolivorans TaxID=266854 RepID=UPI0003FE74D5|nr:TetR family transcriptional regulator [Granulicoccus phenolivorans]
MAGASGQGTDVVVPATRAAAKAERRIEILAAAARLMAARGFHSVRLDDIGQEVGISGPAMYRYFDSKEGVLAELLVGISERLLAGGQQVRDADLAADEVVAGLIARHVDFVLTEPDLILIQFQDLRSLPEGPRHQVRTLQREYAEIWGDALQAQQAGLDRTEARARVHAVFGLLNSSPRLPVMAAEDLRPILTRMALAALAA